MIKIGHGFDVHRFKEGNGFVLGGVKIPYEKSLLAHSDGDVLLHALCDALLGAGALGDIGQHFPDTDPQYANMDSRKLLRKVHDLISEKGYRINNADITILAQAPKMAPFISAMKNNIANDLSCTEEQINVKATTTEALGYIGRKEGIAVHAVVLLTRTL